MRTTLVLTLLFGVCLLAPRFAHAVEVVELIPEKRAPFGATDIFAPITGFFLGGPNYWYKAREIEVETVPPGATLDLFYVRASFQKRYEQAESPVIIRLPSRVAAGKRDAVTIRALLDGYEQAEAHVRVRSREQKVTIELVPLANSLVAVTHTFLAGRGTLAFLTKESLNFRIQKASDGMSVVLTGTAFAPGANDSLDGVASPFVTALKPRQLGQDLVVQVGLTEAASPDRVEVRSRQAFDAVRRLHIFSLDFVPVDGGDAGVHRAKAAFAAITPAAVTGCARAFDSALREELDRAALARALAPAGAFTDPYLREAMKRLGQLSPGGVVTLTDGSAFKVEAPIELMAAWSQAADAEGYLALLRAFVDGLEAQGNRRSTLRGLVAPDVRPAAFDAMVDAAEERERRCRADRSTKAATGRL